MSAGENPIAMPRRAATNPAAQNSAAPAPQAIPAAVAGTSERGAAGLDVTRFLSQRRLTKLGMIISSCRAARAHYQWEPRIRTWPLATAGVLVTAALTAPVAKYLLAMSWTEALLVGAVVASTDAAAVFFLLHACGLRLRPRVNATLEVESATNDPFAIFLTIVLMEILLGGQRQWHDIIILLLREGIL